MAGASEFDELRERLAQLGVHPPEDAGLPSPWEEVLLEAIEEINYRVSRIENGPEYA